MTNLVEIENLQVKFNTDSGEVNAVNGISFNIKKGETLALVGESGSGKSTLALATAGLLNAEEGQIKFMNEDVTTMTSSQIMAYRKKISYIWQDSIGSLSPRMSVGSLITEAYKIHNLKDRDLKMEANRLLKLVGLPAQISERYPHQLSGGQARRVGVARAISLDPKLIIADEPTAGLDVSVQGEILNLLNKLRDDLGVSLFVITHNLNIVRHISDKTAVMYLGRFVEQGQTDDIFANPRHPYTLALLSANLTPYPEVSFENRIELTGEVPSLMDRPNGCEFHTRCPFSSEHCDDEFPPIHTFKSQQILTCHYPLNSN